MTGDELKKEYGDYQTPLDFAELVCAYIKTRLNINPKVIVEPTCGIGTFINASLNTFNSIQRVIGIEINSQYTEECKKNNSNDKRVEENYPGSREIIKSCFEEFREWRQNKRKKNEDGH